MTWRVDRADGIIRVLGLGRSPAPIARLIPGLTAQQATMPTTAALTLRSADWISGTDKRYSFRSGTTTSLRIAATSEEFGCVQMTVAFPGRWCVPSLERVLVGRWQPSI